MSPVPDPLKKCRRGCLFDAKHNFCPWHGEELDGVVGTKIAESFVIEHCVSDAGGFGVVYFAKNELTGAENVVAAVKVLRPNACYDEEAIRDFVDEANRTFELLRD